ncbi:MAG: 30S ribosomal protein S5 [Candidatus Pacearchaeota archaeon]
MAEKEIKGKPKLDFVPVPEELKAVEKTIEILDKGEELPIPLTKQEEKEKRIADAKKEALASWVPKTELGKAVKEGKIKDIDEILSQGKKILEAEIVDTLLNLESDLLLIGQSKGKFGGGKRRAWRQTQKKTMEGNVPSFSCMAVVGDKNGHVGIGMGKSKETLPSREKALREAKLNIIKVTRGFESRESSKADPHTVPFVVEGKCGSVRIKLIPAPRGTGLVIGDECKKILRLAGIKDVYAVTKGQTRTVFNFAQACINALIKTNKMKL